MQLRRLELIGFKTFVNRTELEFHPGVTAIVGPNGSGKSNIMDAIRWALGETNARMLRGARMEDVIFSGSASRRPHSMARVGLTLDNSSGLLPLDYSEIMVSRAVTRGGDGEFGINSVDCRLRDIQMLFLGTGLGGRSYALIGQGEVDAVLRATPVERRQWLEEAAGLARHKRQRIEAERRLGHAQGHLDRLSDVAAELETQQQALAAQAEAAALHRGYTDEVRNLELALYADEARRMLGAVRRLNAQVQNDREAVVTAGDRLTDAGAAIASVEAQLAEATAAYERGQQALLEGAERASALAADVQALGAQADGVRARRDDIAADVQRLGDAVERLRLEAEGLQKEAEAASGEYEALAAALAGAETRLTTSTERERQALIGLNQARVSIVEAARGLAQTHADLAGLRARADVLGQAVEALAEKAAAVDRTADRVDEERRAADAARLAARGALDAAEALITDCAMALESRRVALAALVEEAHAVDVDEQRLRARLASFEEAHQQFLGFEDGVRAVLLEARAAPERFPGFHGALAEMLDVPESYRPSITAALGRRLHCLVVDRHAQIDPVIRFLDGDGHGAATVLALETLRPRHRTTAYGDPANAGGEGAVFARAVEIVRLANGLGAHEGQRLVESLLGDVAIVPDLGAAWRLFAAGYQGRIVTHDGILLSPDGVVSIRGRTAAEAGPLGRSQVIAGLRDTLARIERRRAEVAEQRASAAAHLRAAEESLTAARADADRASETLNERLQHLHTLEAESARLAEDRQALAAEDRPRAEELRRLAEDIARLEAQARELDAEHGRLEDEVLTRQADAARLAAARESAAAESAAQRVALVRLDGRRETLRRLRDDRQASIADLTRRAAELVEAKERLTVEAASIDERGAQAGAAYQALLAGQAASKADLEQINSQRAQLREALAARQADYQAALAAQHEAEASLHRTEVRYAQAETELGTAAARLQQEFGVTLEAAAARRLEGHREDAQRRLEFVRSALRELGPVNLRAIDEHAAMTTRLDALHAHITDLVESSAALREAITHINAGLRVRFRQTFEEVDREFTRLFQRLFEGGEGHLELVETDLDAEPGLEVIAQLPGKARRALVALSGGERVLVALALIFAMLRVHPSPFCIFDEVEAALDDANTRRFTTLLRDLSQQTQVLIITHNKGTMAAADVLYGVTMQEPGVSSLVSVRLVPTADNGSTAGTVAERETVALPAE